MSQAAVSAALRAGLLAAPASGALNNAGLTAFCDAFAAVFWPYLSMTAGANIFLTPEGGIATYMVNGTGSTSVKGSVVSASGAADSSFILQANQYDAIGIVYESGIAAGQPCRVVFAGVAEVLFEDGVAPVRGYWVQAHTTDGRATNLTEPSGGGFVNSNEHFKEIGHCQESKSAGTNVLAKCVVHFN